MCVDHNSQFCVCSVFWHLRSITQLHHSFLVNGMPHTHTLTIVRIDIRQLRSVWHSVEDPDKSTVKSWSIHSLWQQSALSLRVNKFFLFWTFFARSVDDFYSFSSTTDWFPLFLYAFCVRFACIGVKNISSQFFDALRAWEMCWLLFRAKAMDVFGLRFFALHLFRLNEICIFTMAMKNAQPWSLKPNRFTVVRPDRRRFLAKSIFMDFRLLNRIMNGMTFLANQAYAFHYF